MSANKSRLAGAVLLSVVAHLLLIGAALVWLGRPPIYPEPPDEDAMTVRLVPPPPSVPPPAARPVSGAARRVLGRPRKQSETAESVAAAVSAAGAEVGGPSPSEAGAADGEATPERVRRALRSGPVGCANADLVGLNRQERTHCDDLLGRNMAQIKRAMREAEQGRLSTNGAPPSDFAAFMATCRASRQGEGRQPAAHDGLC